MNVFFFFLSNSMPFVFSHFYLSPYGALVLNHLALLFYWIGITCSHVFFLLLFLSSFILMLSIFNCVDIVMAMHDILLDFYDVCPWNFMLFISLSFFCFRDI